MCSNIDHYSLNLHVVFYSIAPILTRSQSAENYKLHFVFKNSFMLLNHCKLYFSYRTMAGGKLHVSCPNKAQTQPDRAKNDVLFSFDYSSWRHADVVQHLFQRELVCVTFCTKRATMRETHDQISVDFRSGCKEQFVPFPTFTLIISVTWFIKPNQLNWSHPSLFFRYFPLPHVALN